MKRDYIYIIIIVAAAIWGFTEQSNASKKEAANIELTKIKDDLMKDNDLLLRENLKGKEAEKENRIKDSLRLVSIDSLILITKNRHDPIKDPVPDANPRNDSIRKWAGEWATQ